MTQGRSYENPKGEICLEREKVYVYISVSCFVRVDENVAGIRKWVAACLVPSVPSGAENDLEKKYFPVKKEKEEEKEEEN